MLQRPALAGRLWRDARLTDAGVAALWIACHIAVWLVLVLTLEGTVRLDIAEAAVGGPEWQLSYPRHPVISEWLTAVAWYCGPLRYGVVFAMSYAITASAFVLVARFVARQHGGRGMLLVLLLGMASSFATYLPIQFNHNIAVLPFCALTLITAWNAFEQRTTVAWLLFGAAVAGGMWAKYAVLHLVGPLGVLFLLVPEWRAELRRSGPWLAALFCVFLLVPHIRDVLAKGGATVEYALDAHIHTWSGRALAFLSFTGIATAAFLVMGVLALGVAGPQAMKRGLRLVTGRRSATRLDDFLTVAAFGPVAVVLASTVFGVSPRPLWVVPLCIGMIAWVGHVALRGGARCERERLVTVGAIGSTVFIAGYVVTRLFAVPQTGHERSSDLDGPALARAVQQYWNQHLKGPIPYIVSMGKQRGLQLAGSVAFDLPYRVHVMEDASLRLSPWIDVPQMVEYGALVISESADFQPVLFDEPLRVIQRIPRPMVRGIRSRSTITLAILPPLDP